VLQRGASPRVVRARIVGTRGTTDVTGPQLRTRFGLFDTWAFFTTVSSNAGRSPVAPPTPAAAPTGGVAARAAAARAAGVHAPVLSGAIEPAKPGARIRVERRAGSKWVLAVDAQLDETGRYAVAVATKGVYRVRYAGTVVGPAVRVR
jgi:stage II sporulation protein D